MKSISKIQLILVTVAATLLALASTFASAEIEKSRLDAIASDLQARVDESMLSGVVALIAQDGEIQMNQAFGYQNVEDQVPMSTDSIFRIFSMTKPVTGTALMMLYDEGKFQLDDPVEKHIPALAGMTVFVSEDSDGNFVRAGWASNDNSRVSEPYRGAIVYTTALGRPGCSSLFGCGH